MNMNMKNQIVVKKSIEDVLNEIDIKFIYDFSRDCNKKAQLMESMLKDKGDEN